MFLEEIFVCSFFAQMCSLIAVQSVVQCTFYLRRRVFVGVTFSIPRSERTSAFGILQQETCLVIFAHWTSTIWSLNFSLKFCQIFIIWIIRPINYGWYRLAGVITWWRARHDFRCGFELCKIGEWRNQQLHEQFLKDHEVSCMKPSCAKQIIKINSS